MKFYISNKKSLNVIFYGQKRSDVREKLGGFSEFFKTPFSENTTDSFLNKSVFCFYDQDNLLSEIEILAPNFFFIKDLNLIKNKHKDVFDYLLENKINFYEDDLGVVIDDLSISTILNGDLIEGVYVNLFELYEYNLIFDI